MIDKIAMQARPPDLEIADLRAQLAAVTKERDALIRFNDGLAAERYALLALVEKAKSALMTQMLQYDDDDAKRLYSFLAQDDAYSEQELERLFK